MSLKEMIKSLKKLSQSQKQLKKRSKSRSKKRRSRRKLDGFINVDTNYTPYAYGCRVPKSFI